jgi:hypothetical protein
VLDDEVLDAALLDDEVLDDTPFEAMLGAAPPLPEDASSCVRAPQPTPLANDANHANRSTPVRSMSRRMVGAGHRPPHGTPRCCSWARAHGQYFMH